MVFLVMSVLPLAALAGGAGGHGHDMSEGHDMEHMEHMGHDKHDDEAGRKGDPADVQRTVDVTMSDNMRFSPSTMKFKKGETVRLVVHNSGRIRHELVIGTMAELKEHAAMMRTDPTMKHADANMLALDPGKKGELVWKFDRAGTFDYACLVPGHLEAGMRGEIVVK